MLVKRDLLDTIVKFLGGREIIVITGMRQVGKTSLIRLLFEKLDNIPSFYLDLEDFNLLDICNRGPDALVAYLKLLGADFPSRTVVAIDEIQYLKNPSNLLKLLHDHHPELKMIVSGSSSLEIRSKFKDSLAGRKAVFELDTLSFTEFLLFRDQPAASIKQNAGSIGDIIAGKLNEAAGMAKGHLTGHLADYLIWGGFPGVTLHADAVTKESMLRDIHTSYIRKDIKEIASIEDISGYNRLLQLLAGQCGNLVNINELSATVGLSVNTVKKYLFFLEQTFIITLLRPYHSNQRKELTKMPKVYFNDIGLRNVAVGNLRGMATPDGARVENFVFSELKKRFVPNETLFFWRTAGGAEVEFVILHEGLPIPVEVKAADMKKPAISRSLRSFIDLFAPVRAIVVNANLCCTVRVNATDVHFAPMFVV
ncbi:MAG: ATP-binding protein [Geobacteraceae bacterium]